MALPYIAAAGMAGLSIASAIEGNKAITKAATASYEANKLFIERDSAVMQNNYMYQAMELNNELGMALTSLDMEFDRVAAETATVQTEREVYGNTADRNRMAVEIKKSLAEDQLQQNAEARMTDIQIQMLNAKYSTEARHAENAQAYSNQMSQRQSTLGIISSGLSAGMSGYSMGANISAANTKLTALQNTGAALNK